MSALRVLQAMAGARHGGAEAFFMRLTVALSRAGLDQHIVMRSDPVRAGKLRTAGIEPVQLRFGGVFDVGTRLALARELSAYRPHVVLTWMSRATQLMPPRFLTGGKYVHVARLGGYYDLKYYRRCDHLVGNTRKIVEYIRDGGWPADRVHYLPNFVDVPHAAPADRAALETPSDATVVLGLGRLHANKAFDVALAAIARTKDVWFWLAGEGELRAALEADAVRLGIRERVRFLGWRDDTAALLAAADILICPSRHEPLGNVVIEGWAARRPVIAAASDGPAALIKDGESGLLVPVNDADALASAIQRVAQEPQLAARLAAGGHAAYESEFTEAAVVRRYLDFFDRIARK
ncbi:MAG TPA: glycosyltransferase [Alphaproteobacteria bacterium]